MRKTQGAEYEGYTEGNFLGLPTEFSHPINSQYAVLPVAFEGTVCFLKGTARGPESIIDVSAQMEWYDEQTREEYYRAGIYTAPTLVPSKDELPEEFLTRVNSAVDLIIKNKQIPLTLGGEHSITSPVVAALQKNEETAISVLQIDAHADLRNTYTGGKSSHASVMRRVLEITDSITQVGIRSFSLEEAEQCPERINSIITVAELEDNTQECIKKINERLNKKVYITIDLDGFDPSIAPGVGTPEPGGLTWRPVIEMLKNVIKHHDIVGADIVEAKPLGADLIQTEFLAARLLCKIISFNEFYKNNKEENGQEHLSKIEK